MILKRRAQSKVTPPMPLSVSGTMLSHPGCVRQLNEDVVTYVLPGDTDRAAERGALAIVADGMGGHAAGEVASRIAADTVQRLFYRLKGAPPEVLAACFTAANRAINERSRTDPACSGMGTTCTALALCNGAAFLGHIGDSRAYLLRQGQLQQISEDHSLVAELVRSGSMTEEEAVRSPERNVIVRALGICSSAEPLIWREGFPVQVDDIFVLCSDGLSDFVHDETIADIVERFPPFEASHALIDAALASDGTDNVSVGVFVVGTSEAQPGVVRPTRPLERPGGPA
jgi:protein phosphatase